MSTSHQQGSSAEPGSRAGKLAAMHEFVTSGPDALSPPPFGRAPERLAPDSPAFTLLRSHVAVLLGARSAEIAARWEEQSRTVALRETAQAEGPGREETVPALVGSLAVVLASDGATSDDLIALGLTFGVDAFARGGSLHHALKGLDLLSAMILYAVETILASEPSAVTSATPATPGTPATAADGIRMSRRLQQASSLLTLAVTKGYTQAMSDSMRERFRHLRHDLRNPLGTIKSVLAMMDDETMPAEARAHPRFRAMAKRNARSLGELIADRLSDAEAIAPALVQQRASLRTIACGVRRDLRAEAGAREATVVVGSALARVMVDAVGLELMLHELLFAALQDARPGDELRLEFGEVRDDHASVTLVCEPARPLIAAAGVLERLTALASQMRGELETRDQDTGHPSITILVPVQRVDVVVRVPESSSTVIAALSNTPVLTSSASDGRESSYDLRSAGEREHGESGPL